MASKTFLYISLCSFGILIVTGAVSFFQPQKKKDTFYDIGTTFWTILSYKLKDKGYFPLIFFDTLAYILFGILFILGVISLVFMIIHRNNDSVEEGMLGLFSKFHFIPLLCASALYIIGFCISNKNSDNDEIYVFSLIFSAIGLSSLIFIYLKTDISSSTHVRLVIKKGLYSCLIALFIYNIFFTINIYGYLKKLKKFDKGATDWLKGCSIAFSIIIGLVNISLSFFLKDVFISGMNILIYLGMIITFFNSRKEAREGYNGVTEGILDIIISVLTIANICFLIYKYKTKLIE